MYETISLIKRNIKMYIRDPLAVFFSFLSTIILMLIYILFLGDIGGSELALIITPKETDFLIYSQMLAGIIVLNSLTIPLGNLGSMVQDFDLNKIDAFMVTPVKRYKVILGYYFSSLIITLVFSIIFWILGIVVLGLVTGIFHSLSTFLLISLLIILYVFISTSFMVLLATFIKSVNAFGAVAGIFGSLIGFVSGIYIPLSSNSSQVLINISSLFPFSHMTILLKQILLKPSYDNVLSKENGSIEIVNSIKDGFGANEIGLLGFNIPLSVLIIAAAILSFILLMYAGYRLNKRVKA